MLARSLWAAGAAGALLLLSACRGEDVDWTQPENFVLREESAKRGDGIELRYWSLVDATCDGVYAALAEVENYPEFIEGVDRVVLKASSEDAKTVDITQRVIGRQQNAVVAWKLDPRRRTISFDTLESDLSRNSGSYEMRPSPDGKRCLVRTTFLVLAGPAAQAVPIGVLASGTRDAFVAAARGVKSRAAAKPSAAAK